MRKLLSRFKTQVYNIGFIHKSIDNLLNSPLKKGEIVWLKHKYKDRFFADPFLIDEDENNYYILVEEYPFWTEKGFISLLTVNKKTHKLVNKKEIINEPWHLSFPFCEFKGDYIIPEAFVSNKCTKYYFDKEKREVTNKEVIFNEGLIDSVFYKDFVLTAKNDLPKEKLFLLKRDTNKYVNLNKGNPILKDASLTRCAGNFFSHNNKLYRPTQDCLERYGKQVVINEVLSLSDSEIKQRQIITLNSFENKPFNVTMHTFNVYDDVIIVDGSKDHYGFITKPIFKLVKKIKHKNDKSN